MKTLLQAYGLKSLVIFLFLFSCDADSLSTEKKANRIDIESLEELKNMLAVESAQENLIVKIESHSDSATIHYEDALQISYPVKLVQAISYNDTTWQATFNFVNETQSSYFYLGKQLTFDNKELNPFSIAPLVARVKLNTAVNGHFKMTVVGKNGIDSDIENESILDSKTHTLNILGLYPNYTNSVKLTFFSPDGISRLDTIVEFITAELPSNLPKVTIVKQYSTSQKNKVFLINYKRTNIPFMLDRFGQVRWYSTGFSAVSKFGLHQLSNSNLIFGVNAPNQGDVVEYSLMGKLEKTYSVFPSYENIHHDVIELPNGNLLVTVDKVGENTIEDHVLELDRSTGNILTVWDLRESLQTDRKHYRWIRNGVDWFHNNAIAYDSRDNTLILSGVAQGIVKVTWANKLRWILAPPEGWSDAFKPYLLRAENPSLDFDWNWGQHAPEILPNGNLFIFDNGFGRNYTDSAKYSRAVEYKITENDSGGTVEQVWAYGKSRGESMFSPIVSDVDYLAESQTRLITSGSMAYVHTYTDSVNNGNQPNASLIESRIIELSESKEVLFEMYFTSPNTGLTYRAEKIEL